MQRKLTFWFYVIASLSFLVLTSCATTSGHHDFEKRGLASWYGPGHQGKKTASGEIFDMNQMTAAHRTLAFGTWVRVRSEVDGKEARVRINDRGPYAGKRILDVSRAAAEKLGMLSRGELPVELRLDP